MKTFHVHVENRQTGVLTIEAHDAYHAYRKAKRYTKNSRKIIWQTATFIIEDVEDPAFGITSEFL